MITVSDKAKERILELKKEEGRMEQDNIRVSVKGGGCSGLMYELGFDDPYWRALGTSCQGKWNLANFRVIKFFAARVRNHHPCIRTTCDRIFQICFVGDRGDLTG